MSEVRILVQGTTKDADAFTTYMKNTFASLEESEPGTTLMEAFVDPSNGAAVIHERYADADAFVAHSAALMEGEGLQRFMEVFEFKRMTFLSPIDDERVGTIADQFGATKAAPIAGFAR